MNPRFLMMTLLLPFFLTAGCAQIQEVTKTFWGSSTRALEKARSDALGKTFSCNVDDCYQNVLAIITLEEYTLFINNTKKNTIVVMGVPGSVDTTEVGIFFSPENATAGERTKVEVTSLSSNAKQTVAKALFAGLEKTYGVAP